MTTDHKKKMAAAIVNNAAHPAQPSSGMYPAGFHIPIKELCFDDDELTPVRVSCLACKGRIVIVREKQFQYAGRKCNWCTGGCMSSEQINVYRSAQAEAEFDQTMRGGKDVDDLLKGYVNDEAEGMDFILDEYINKRW